MNGLVKVTTNASLQAKIKQIRHEKNKPSAASTAMPRLSVVRPFTELMSSVIMFVRMPGALFLLSNQPMCLCNNASNNRTLNLNVRFSPPLPK